MTTYWFSGAEPVIVWFVRVILVCSLVSCLAFAVAGCTTPNTPTSLASDVQSKEELPPGSSNTARNQQPHGGTDEKSDSAPKKSTRWFW